MFNGKNILVAGGSGFVGANLIRRLLDIGSNVRATLHKKDAVINTESLAQYSLTVNKNLFSCTNFQTPSRCC